MDVETQHLWACMSGISTRKVQNPSTAPAMYIAMYIYWLTPHAVGRKTHANEEKDCSRDPLAVLQLMRPSPLLHAIELEKRLELLWIVVRKRWRWRRELES